MQWSLAADDSVSDDDLHEIEKSCLPYLRLMLRDVHCQLNELSE